MVRRLEVAHHLLAHARGLVRILRPVVQSFVPPMLDVQAGFVVRRRVAAQLVRDDHVWAAYPLDSAGSRRQLAPDQVVVTISGRKRWLWRAVDQHGAVLVHSRRDKAAAKRLMRRLPRRHGLPHRFVRQFDSPCRQHLLNHAQA
nr:DDE-type integrase/transposase/recombinase [Paraburkholderia kirstenboschensis]